MLDRRFKILIVDSYGSSGATLARLLRLEGYRARSATTIAAALCLCEGEPIDLLVCDLQLADGTGASLLNELKHRYGIPGISLDGIAVAEPVEDAERSGFKYNLVKPISFDELLELVERMSACEPAGA